MVQFDSFQAFMVMGGHGVFVWSVYAIAMLVMVLLIIIPLQKSRRFFIRQAMVLKRQQGLELNAADSSRSIKR